MSDSVVRPAPFIARCICGIDPGLSGAIAFYFPEIPDRVTAEDLPVAGGSIDCATLAARIAQMAPSFAVVERVGAMPRQGVSSTFKFGSSYGCLLGVLGALQIRTVLVTPQTWKKHFRLDSDKEKSRSLALRNFAKSPEHFARKKDDGRAEAALLALYGSIIDGARP
jgi:crossover junction endodeoxyribonuclease RuvC